MKKLIMAAEILTLTFTLGSTSEPEGREVSETECWV